MMKRIITFILFTTSLLINGNAQTMNVLNKTSLIPNLPNLTVGDELPDFVIPKIIRGSKIRVSTTDFKDQLLIIDFWSIYCSGCIEALPKMEVLQKQFGNQIKILPVTFEPSILVENFWKKNKYLQKLTLPSVVEDSLFNSYFRHKTIPHEVWIYKGKVIAITTSQYVDENNIKKVLSGTSINWPVKDDFFLFNGKKQALFQLNENQIDTNSSPIHYAAIQGYKEGVNSEGLSGGSGIIKDFKKKTIRFFSLNQPIYTAYMLTWGNLIKMQSLVKPILSFAPNQVIWEVSDKSKYMYDHKKAYQAEWMRKYGICFESLTSDTGQTEFEVSKSIIRDMDMLLGLHVRWEKRKEKVLVLIRTSKEDKLNGKHLIKKDNGLKNKHKQFKDVPLSQLIYTLNQQEKNPYIFDETAYKNLVNIKLNISSWTDIPSIRRELNKYDLDLKEEERDVDKFILSETNYSYKNEQ